MTVSSKESASVWYHTFSCLFNCFLLLKLLPIHHLHHRAQHLRRTTLNCGSSDVYRRDASLWSRQWRSPTVTIEAPCWSDLPNKSYDGHYAKTLHFHLAKLTATLLKIVQNLSIHCSDSPSGFSITAGYFQGCH